LTKAGRPEGLDGVRVVMAEVQREDGAKALVGSLRRDDLPAGPRERR
jgi:hypothetical protein